ncbi:MOSC domain-containing protein [Sphaerimonospora thailandensis]|uniref:GTP-binding protein n=1 Tax=Sphaerimonospora thailandensis TaxID=795644 RepID=A0A8J3R560_9ACTN|nr:MOSC domain-containing protein [Sphaerimonospora thailandensis]GIH68031.1 GTP-binding protein [Sphaerimonospora thailandensis]
MFLGHVAELWRHPVKSMRGDRLPQVAVTEGFGVPGDRGWALRDEKAGEIRGAKKITSLLRFHARYLTEPAGASTPPVEITFPDGTTMTSDDERIDEALSEALGRQVSLWPRRPADDHDHYRRASRLNEQELREQLGLDPDEPIPDYSKLPASVMSQLRGYATPRGTYFDALPLSLLTTTSMGSLGEMTPDAVIDSRRFRKNIIVEGAPALAGFPEFDWVGRRLRIGTVLVEVVMPISRCVMVVLPQADLPHDRPILRSLVKHTDMNFGVYLRVIEPGEISEGDPVELC